VQATDIRQAVLETIASIAPECDLRQIRGDRPLRAQVDLDSMDWLNLVAALQQRLSVEISDADATRLATLDAIVGWLQDRQAASPLPATSATAATGPAPARHRVNGIAVTVRPIGPDDLALEAQFVRHLSAEARYKRFLATVSELPERKLRYFTEVDQVRHVALAAVAERAGAPAIAGVARYIVDPAGRACEFAIVVDDAWQGSGLAGILMRELIGVARASGLATMEGTVLATNTRMLKFARQLGFVQQHDPRDRDTVNVSLRL
jgi:acetyltransferase